MPGGADDLLGDSFQDHFLCRLELGRHVLHLTPIDPVAPAPAGPTHFGPGPGGTTKLAVDLLPLMNVDRDALDGTWTRDEKGRLIADGSHNALIAVPFDPPAEYDYAVTFAHLSGRDQLAQLFTAGQTNLIWAMGAWGQQMEFRRGSLDLGDSRDDHITDPGVTHTSVVRVRRSGVTVVVDGKQVARCGPNRRTPTGRPPGRS